MIYTDIMIDLETLGTAPGSVILSIGAVAFSSLSNVVGPTLHEKINIQNSLDAGFITQKDTIEWWAQQDKGASNIIEECSQSTTTIRQALLNFRAFLQTNTNSDTVCVWGCGSDFDNVILSTAYQRSNIVIPWKFYNSRCYRTAKNLFPEITLERSGTHHNAIDDALYQTHHLLKIFHNE